MASINASTSGAGGVITTADNTGNLELQSGGSAIATVSSTGLSLATGKTLSVGGVIGSPFTMKNRIINGDMVIDQRAAGASATAGNNTYVTCDRWATFSVASSKYTVQQNAGSVTPPAGFTNYLGATSSAATSLGTGDYYFISQRIEGYNVADLGWGTANAKTVTLSFWARSSLTGTFGGSINSNSYTRAYPFTYTISSANTWTQVSVTIPGDTTGTWLTSNNIGLIVIFNLGCGSTVSGTAGAWTGTANIFAPTGATSVVGTNGATFYFTGVQLEQGSSATSFEWLPYNMELFNCYRYYYKYPGSPNIHGMLYATSKYIGHVWFPAVMRTTPTIADLTGNYNTIEGVGVSNMYMMRTADNTYLTTYTASAEL